MLSSICWCSCYLQGYGCQQVQESGEAQCSRATTEVGPPTVCILHAIYIAT